MTILKALALNVLMLALTVAPNAEPVIVLDDEALAEPNSTFTGVLATDTVIVGEVSSLESMLPPGPPKLTVCWTIELTAKVVVA